MGKLNQDNDYTEENRPVNIVICQVSYHFHTGRAALQVDLLCPRPLHLVHFLLLTLCDNFIILVSSIFSTALAI